MNYNLKKPICQMEQSKRSGLFARLAEIAYADKKKATAYAKAIGFTKTQFFDVDGAQAYIFSNKDDCVVACRGTEPTEFNDIKADLNALMVDAELDGKVHKGFRAPCRAPPACLLYSSQCLHTLSGGCPLSP